MVLDCQFLDSNGAVFASARVSKPLMDHAIAFYPLYFDRSVRLKRNPERHHASFRINVVVNQRAYFLLGNSDVLCLLHYFLFYIERSYSLSSIMTIHILITYIVLL